MDEDDGNVNLCYGYQERKVIMLVLHGVSNNIGGPVRSSSLIGFLVLVWKNLNALVHCCSNDKKMAGK